MSNYEKSLVEINATALELLSKNIGLTNTFRFLNQFSRGHGDYTEDRKEVFKDLTIDEVVQSVKKNKLK